MSFHTISNILKGPIPLQTAIDNSNYDKKIGIRSLTVWIGWYNTTEDSLMVMTKLGLDAGEDDGDPNTGVSIGFGRDFYIKPGLRGVNEILKVGSELEIPFVVNNVLEFKKIEINPISIDYNSGLCTVTVLSGFILFMSVNIVAALGLSSEGMVIQPGRVGYPQGTYTGQINMWPKFFDINLKQIGTSDNILDGKTSRVFSKISIPQHVFGESFSIIPTTPLYKKLTAGIITELELTFNDCDGNIIDNHGLPISIELEII